MKVFVDLMIDWLQRHVDRHLRRTPWSFCWRTSVEQFIVSLALAYLLSVFITDSETPDERAIEEYWFAVVIVAPLFETFWFQVVPIGLARWFRMRFTSQVMISAVLFAWAHFPRGVVTGVCAGIIGGLYFGIGYAHWRKQSLWTALWTTAMAHSLHNFMVCVLIFPYAECLSGGVSWHYTTIRRDETIDVLYFTNASQELTFAVIADDLMPIAPTGQSFFGSYYGDIQVTLRRKKWKLDCTYSPQARRFTVGESEIELDSAMVVVVTSWSRSEVDYECMPIPIDLISINKIIAENQRLPLAIEEFLIEARSRENLQLPAKN